MYRIFSCLVSEHNYWLVGLAAIVCVSTTLTSYITYAIAVAASGLRRVGWAVLTGVAAGSGIWTTHFVAMLAYEGGLPTAFDPVVTLGSFLIAVALATCAFVLSASGNRWMVAGGGIVAGIAIGAMHYVGMAALMVPGTMSWDALIVVSSLVIGVFLATAAMHAFHKYQGTRAIVTAALLLTLAICGLHFTAMGALIVVPDPTIVFQSSGFNRAFMAISIAGVTFVVILSALAGAVVQSTNNRCEDALRAQNARFEAAVRYLPVGLSMFGPDEKLILCNDAYREIYDLSEDATRPGTAFSEIMTSYARKENGGDDHSALAHLREWLSKYSAKLARGKPFTDTQPLKDGRTIFVRIGPIAGGGWVDVQEDITERKQQEAKIAHMAKHDMLTGLPNRVLLRERLEKAVKNPRRKEKVALLCLDLDHFKDVNDTLGHPVGDKLLQFVSERLLASVRECDMVARIGGDEFVVLVTSADPAREASEMASRIIEAVSAPYDVSDHKIMIGTSVGIAVSREGETDVEKLLSQGDLALYRSKYEGRGAYSFFEEELDTRMRLRRELELDLRLALAGSQFYLEYQPLLNLERNEVAGVEALLRWAHPQRGVISPVEFIPLAEETGLIISIGEWVLRQACADAAKWPDNVRVAVNLSPKQFKSRTLVDMVFNAVAAAGIRPQRLELEITESALLNDSEATLDALRRLHAFGVRIAMDDFGTGYSSLSYLGKFPFDKIKIDRYFIANLKTGESSLAILRAISSLGRALGLSTTAEGVETEEQLETIRAEGCTEIQGFYYSRPKPVAEIDLLFASLPPPPANESETAAA
jgi:diguanylate cyclase (GGDEF)-like protein